MCTRRVLPACAFARTWVPPWRARGSWQTQSRKIQPTSRRIQPKSRKIQPTSREIQPKSLELATSRHNNINPPPDKRARDARVVAHPKQPRQGSLSCVFKAWVVWKVPHVQLCLYRATGLWHRGVGHGFGHGFGLGTGFFSLKGETKKAREVALLLLLHMNRVSLVWVTRRVCVVTQVGEERERERERKRESSHCFCCT